MRKFKISSTTKILDTVDIGEYRGDVIFLAIVENIGDYCDFGEGYNKNKNILERKILVKINSVSGNLYANNKSEKPSSFDWDNSFIDLVKASIEAKNKASLFGVELKLLPSPGIILIDFEVEAIEISILKNGKFPSLK